MDADQVARGVAEGAVAKAVRLLGRFLDDLGITGLHPPTAAPGITDEEARTILELMAKGSFFGVNLATADLDGTFERIQAGDTEVVQEPTEQPYGVRDCAVRDPAGNLIRIQELR